MKRMFPLLALVCVASGMLWAADSPFAGKWKLNPARSRMSDVMKVRAAGPNKYDFNLGGTEEPIVVDGTDQPGIYGTTLAVTAEAPDLWKVERKNHGHTMVIGIWKLSADSRTLTDHFTSYRTDGTTSQRDYIYKRTAGGPGFDGTWESKTVDVNSRVELEIAPYGEDGISLSFPASGLLKKMKFDGKAYPNTGGVDLAGYTGSARRIDERTIEITDKVKDKRIDTQRMVVSPNGRTLTITVSIPNRDAPQIQVFDRE